MTEKSDYNRGKLKLIFIGSFNAEKHGVFGGVARSCGVLMQSEFATSFQIIPLDSTQRSNPPPTLTLRWMFAVKRLFVFLFLLVWHRPSGVLAFASGSLSFIEKSLLLWIASLMRCKTFLFPRAGSIIEWVEQSPLRPLLVQLMLKRVSCVFCQGKTFKKFASDVCKVKDENIVIVNNWTACKSDVARGRIRLTKQIGFKKSRLLFVGWLENEKGVWDLIEALSYVRKRGRNFKVSVVGDGSQKDKLVAKAKELGISNMLDFKGWLQKEELNNCYSQNDIFVLPSWNEGFPNALIEAISFGLCPVVTNVGMICDHLTDGVHGRIVPAKDPELFASAVIEVIDKPHLAKQYASAANTVADRSFNPETSIGKLCEAISRRMA